MHYEDRITQDAVHHVRTKSDKHGEGVFAPGVAVKVWWWHKVERITTAEGRDHNSMAQIYTLTPLTVGDRIKQGTDKTLPTTNSTIVKREKVEGHVRALYVHYL